MPPTDIDPLVPSFMSTEEFDAFEADRPHEERWELCEGRPLLKADEPARHGVIKANIVVSLIERFGDGPCRTYMTDLKVQNAARAFSAYPDIVVRCAHPPLDLESAMTDPTLVMEILSPSTEDYDLERKRIEYCRIPSLALYAVVHCDKRCIQTWTREDGDFRESRYLRSGEAVALPIGIRLPMDEIYEDTPVP